MLNIRNIIVAASISVLLYLLAFGFALHKPLTVGSKRDRFDLKINYLSQHAHEQKIVVFAGSNGRFSHRCETIGSEAGYPCSNMALSAGSSLKWQFGLFQRYLKAGDLVYLPLEYRTSVEQPIVGDEVPYIVAYDKRALALYEPLQLLHALFYFDLKYLFSSGGEMLLAAMGKERRYGVKTLTSQGDEHGHTEERAIAYRSFVLSAPAPAIAGEAYRTQDQWADLVPFLDWASAQGIIVVGGLPTTVQDVTLPENLIPFMQKLYADHGQCFFTLPNLSRYPRASFFDGVYHLNESAQIAHSRLLAPHLKRMLEQGGCEAHRHAALTIQR